MNTLMILAQSGADSPANKWLNENPLILGLIAILIGAVLAGSGVYELRTGVSRDKYGKEITGAHGKFTSGLRIVFGAGICVFGLYKMLAG